ncbi:hypothetical protein [Hymenobacter sp. IS2118]|uniref:hypothetical protein n=1 Tax=Hymenobacter sp. IS2118 TaxID=1505605 RepID=UPI0012691945|nr:hypothetical protein [Hymenobacter sp. IS2118]
MIETSVNSAKGRPHQLFFTGDQIYADDVSTAGLAIIQDIKQVFIGNWSEFGSLPDNKYLFGTPRVTRTEVGNRIEFVKSIHLSNSIEDGQNHLLSLGEFMAMYLLNWSDVLWPMSRADLPSFESIYRPLGISNTEKVFVPVSAPVGAVVILPPIEIEEQTELSQKFLDDSNKLWMTHQALKDVRRAMANVPVYMMWDDHEVADDWFFSFNWTQKVMGWGPEPANPYGRLLIQNGMTAFNIFQGWGNAPERYVPFTAGGFLLQAANKILASPTEWQVTKNWTDLAELVLPTWGPATFGTFSGTALTSPIEYDLVMHFGEYAVLMLDTRSNRFFRNTFTTDATVGRDRPVLMRQERLAQLVSETFALQTQYNLRVVVVVSPAPVIGHNIVTHVIEKTQIIFDLTPRQHLLTREPTNDEAERRDGIDLTLDSEAWSGNAIGLEELLRQVSTFKRVIILSGDVHFSYSSVARYWTDAQLPQTSAAIGQLTCSAAKNSTKKPGFYIETASNEFWSNPGMVGNVIIAPRSFVGWADLTTASGQPHRVRLRRKGQWQVRSNPTVIGLSDPLRDRYVLLNRNDMPDWRYTYSFCQDSTQATLTARRQDYVEPTNPNLTHWERLATEHALYSHNGNKGIVVNSDNIGEVTFKWTGINAQELQVQHGLWYALLDPESEPDANIQLVLKPYTVHTLDLTVPTMTEMPGEFFN